MSQFVGFKCDICGSVFETGIRMSGDKKSEVQCGRSRHAYRFDLCNDCFDEFMAFAKREKPTKKQRMLDAAMRFVEVIKQAHNATMEREVCRLVNNALVEFADRKIAIMERDEP